MVNKLVLFKGLIGFVLQRQLHTKIFILISLLFVSTYILAANWEPVAENRIGDIFYIDESDIRNRNGMIYYRVLTDNLEPTPSGVVSSIDQYKANQKTVREFG